MRLLGWIALTITTAAHADPDIKARTTEAPTGARTHWQRMLLETAGLFAVGEAHYYRGDGRANANDWQLPGNWSALGRKLTGDGIRFDSNGFATNAISHPVLFGATVHELARENGFSLAQSFLISSGISIAWEFIGEWREYASINDIATTSPAGTPIGEAAYQIIHHLRRTQFELHGGMGRVGGTSFHTIGASASLDTIPHHDEPGDSSGTIREGNKVALALEVPFDDSARAIDFRSRSSLYGYYRNHRDDDGNGYNLFVGIAGGYDYLQKMDRPDWQWDLLANVVAGPTIDLELHTHGVRLHTALDVSGDFAMVKSYAYGKWRDAHPMAVVQGVLQDNPHYYYYALGASLVPRIEIEGRGLAAGASFARSMFTSLDGHDRNQEIETTQIHLEDEEQTTTGWLRGQLAGVTLQVSASDRTREGRIGMTVDASTERTLVLSLGYRN